MERNENNRGNRNRNVERNHQNRYYHGKQDSDIYENEFENEEEFYDYGEHHLGHRNNIDNDGEYGYQHRDGFDSDYDPQHENDPVDGEIYEQQRSHYVSRNPNRYRKPSKRRKFSEAHKRKLIRQHYTMMNLRVAAERT